MAYKGQSRRTSTASEKTREPPAHESPGRPWTSKSAVSVASGFESARSDQPMWWKLTLSDKKLALNDGLRKIASTILKSCHTHKIIKDRDFQRLRNLRREMIVDEILNTISQGDSHTYELFRQILRDQKQTALYELLDMDNKDKLEKDDSGASMADYIRDLRDELHENNLKMDSVMEAVKRVEHNQAEEIKRLRSDYDLRQQECNKLKETNASLNAKITALNQKLKQNKGSREEVRRLETELRAKQQELKKNGESKKALETTVAELRDKIKVMESEMSSDILQSKR